MSTANPDERFNKNEGTAANPACVNIKTLYVDHNPELFKCSPFSIWSVGSEKRKTVA